MGGYETLLRPLKAAESFEIVAVSSAGPQFEAEYLDDADFFLGEDGRGGVVCARLGEYEGLGFWPGRWEEVLRVCEEDKGEGGREFILFKRGEVEGYPKADEKGEREKGYFKVTAIGTGFFADVVRSGINIGDILMPLILRAVEQTLSTHSYPNIGAIEFPDFSGWGLFTPSQTGIKNEKNDIGFVKAPYRDMLGYDKQTRERYVCRVLNPGDCFARVGNELGYGSVEAMIGNNATIMRTQCYIWNEEVLNEGLRIAVES